jgi:oligogalacturonide transport system permease protein
MKESNAPVTGRTPFQKWLDKYQGILYLIPWIIGFVVFKAFPFGQSLYYSFTDMNFFKSGTTFVGLQNYITAFTTTKIRRKNTGFCGMGLLAGPTCVTLTKP